jgi:hypothetical protein
MSFPANFSDLTKESGTAPIQKFLPSPPRTAEDVMYILQTDLENGSEMPNRLDMIHILQNIQLSRT